MKIFVFLWLVVFFAGCSSHKASKDWTITIGAGGGITGGSSGFRMDGKGKLESWQIVTPKDAEEKKELFTTECDTSQFFKTYLDFIRFDTIRYVRPSNWTHFVELKAGETVHRVSWGNEGPMHVQSFYDLFMGFVNSRAKR
jgi:hypothetical protein